MSANGLVIWMTGLSGAGKSTLARELHDKLKKQGIISIILDGDTLRSGISRDLGFSDSDRQENIRRAAEMARLISSNGIIVIASLITPFDSLRKLARSIIGDDHFEVYIKASIEACEKRDVKGLYKKARTGGITAFTGISSNYEEPANPDLVVETEDHSVEECVEQLLSAIAGKIYL